MGKQICPDEPLFAASAAAARGAGALVDLNLEGGENRVDIDLFGDPEGERSIDQTIAKDIDDSAPPANRPACMPARTSISPWTTRNAALMIRRRARCRRVMNHGGIRADEFLGLADGRVADIEVRGFARPHFVQAGQRQQSGANRRALDR